MNAIKNDKKIVKEVVGDAEGRADIYSDTASSLKVSSSYTSTSGTPRAKVVRKFDRAIGSFNKASEKGFEKSYIAVQDLDPLIDEIA